VGATHDLRMGGRVHLEQAVVVASAESLGHALPSAAARSGELRLGGHQIAHEPQLSGKELLPPRHVLMTKIESSMQAAARAAVHGEHRPEQADG
jgi:hypothetical protein